MKAVKVAAAIIKKDDKIFATQRGYGEFRGGWEFPGGKIEPGETAECALTREIKEELEASIEIEELFETVEYDYPTFHLTMYCFICRLSAEKIVLKEHEDARWLDKDGLDTVEWLPADEGVIEKLRKQL